MAAWPLAARAQKSLPRIGWLVYGGATLGPIDQSLKDALAQVGLVDGRNIEVVFRYANGKTDQLASSSRYSEVWLLPGHLLRVRRNRCPGLVGLCTAEQHWVQSISR